MKKKTEDQRGGQFTIGPTAGQERTQTSNPSGSPWLSERSFGSSGELLGDMADTYPRSLSQSMTGLCWVLLVFAPLGRGLLKGLPPCRGD